MFCWVKVRWFGSDFSFLCDYLFKYPNIATNIFQMKARLEKLWCGTHSPLYVLLMSSKTGINVAAEMGYQSLQAELRQCLHLSHMMCDTQWSHSKAFTLRFRWAVEKVLQKKETHLCYNEDKCPIENIPFAIRFCHFLLWWIGLNKLIWMIHVCFCLFFTTFSREVLLNIFHFNL